MREALIGVFVPGVRNPLPLFRPEGSRLAQRFCQKCNKNEIGARLPHFGWKVGAPGSEPEVRSGHKVFGESTSSLERGWRKIFQTRGGGREEGLPAYG